MIYRTISFLRYIVKTMEWEKGDSVMDYVCTSDHMCEILAFHTKSEKKEENHFPFPVPTFLELV